MLGAGENRNWVVAVNLSFGILKFGWRIPREITDVLRGEKYNAINVRKNNE